MSAGRGSGEIPASPLRLLLVTHSLSGGGAERFAANLASHLDRRRFVPAVCAVIGRRTYPVPEDVPVTALGYGGLHHLPKVIRGLRWTIAAGGFDLVLSNVLSTSCVTGGALAGLPRRRRPPWVARVGNAPGIGEPWLHRLWARRVYPLAQALVLNSRGMTAAMERLYPGTAGRSVSLPNPTDFAAIERRAAEAPPPFALRAGDGAGELTLLWVGRLTRQKRPDLALEVLARVRRRRPARLWLLGEGPLAGEVARRIAALGLAGAVEAPGFVANPFPLLRRADLFLLTSDFEGLPNALIEAQGLGLPAVAGRCPYGPDEIVEDGVTGRLVPPGDAAAAAEAVLGLAADREALRRMGEAAAAAARRRFDLPRVIPRWEELLLRAAGGETSGDLL